MYTSLLVLAEMYFYYSADTNLFSKLVLFKLDWNFFGAFSIIFFAFTCLPGYYSSIEALVKKDAAHYIKIVVRSLSVNLLFYSLIAAAGYLSTFDETPDNILLRKSPFGEKGDIAMLIAKIIISIGLTIAVPINYVPMRTSLWGLIYGNANYTFTK
jgi:amino acid permease